MDQDKQEDRAALADLKDVIVARLESPTPPNAAPASSVSPTNASSPATESAVAAPAQESGNDAPAIEQGDAGTAQETGGAE